MELLSKYSLLWGKSQSQRYVSASCSPPPESHLLCTSLVLVRKAQGYGNQTSGKIGVGNTFLVCRLVVWAGPTERRKKGSWRFFQQYPFPGQCIFL